MKDAIGILTRITLFYRLSYTYILTRLFSQMHEHEMNIHLFALSSTIPSNFIMFIVEMFFILCFNLFSDLLFFYTVSHWRIEMLLRFL